MNDLLTQETPAKPKPKPASPPPSPPPPAAVAAKQEDPWHDMASAPKNGMYVFLKGDPCADATDEVTREWFWYSTRQFRKGTWQACGWWRRRFGPNAPPSFTPEGWRNAKEGLPA